VAGIEEIDVKIVDGRPTAVAGYRPSAVRTGAILDSVSRADFALALRNAF
jgi:hypothetical protein